ncbi:HalOD1 output domain-containing protein [Halobellus rarus]|uniref:HalOD1 output domain-containing protein n=1 Tax=Halobellus rarus TaxID=1126237 RepID=A0ABD6CJT2_9EURY|nr:HalOD1 output domain-containing protein [Halobellus rarus]
MPQCGEPESLTEEVILQVAESEDTSPMELSPLAEVIDPDALETVVSSDSVIEVSFRYEGYTVIIDRNGNVTLQG